jgi:ankyrin repeat protein
VALAWAIMSKHFQVADFLLAHGADVNTDRATHEPASILHEGARFLIARGVDLTIRDHRWNGTAAGWAWHAANDQAMLTDAEEERKSS